MVLKWQIQNKELINDLRLFKILKNQSYHPQKNLTHNFIVLDSNDWVNVIPITKDNKVALIKQYRAGTEDITLEIPGGVVEKSENFTEAGIRELKEETGLITTEWETLGFVHPNPAIQNNKCHFILAKNCEQTGQTNFDNVEDIEIEIFDLKEIPNLIQSHQITHALVQCAFYKLFQLYPKYLNL